MSTAKTIPVKFSSGCIAVKEDYQLTRIYNTNRYNISAVFCTDSFQRPCRACILRGNALTPLCTQYGLDINNIIAGRKGVYSRLDCVANIVSLKGVFEKYPNGSKAWVTVSMNMYVPIGVAQNSSLSVINIATRLPKETVEVLKQNVLANLGETITSKESFIASRI